MDLLQVVLSSIFSVIALFLLTKLIGNRQMSQLSMFDYINGITIGSIAAEMATSLEKNLFYPLTAMIIYSLSAVGVDLISNKKMKSRRFLEGHPWIIFKNGKFYIDNLNKQKIDVNEVIAECRTQGYFDINNIELIMLEHNGKLSILPKADQRYSIPQDFNIMPEQEMPAQIVVYEGKIISDNLKHTGNNEEWIKKQLEQQHISLKDVFIGMCDYQNQLNVYRINTN